MKTYKYAIYLLFIPLLLLFISACEDEKDAPNFKIVKTTIDGDPAKLEGQIEVSTSDFEFTVSNDWCNVTKEGNILKLEAGANYDFHNRTVEVIITSGDTQYRVPVTQTGILFEFAGDKIVQYNFGLKGGDRTTQLLTNINYEVVIPEECKDWIEVEKLENSSQKILVKESKERREGKVIFKYLEKTIEIKISQFDYLGYKELLGPAKMTYTNSKEERVTTDIEIVEREENKTFTVKGTFESGISREIPLQFLDDETHKGELRFIPGIIDPDFEDPEKDSKIKSLVSMLLAKQYLSTGIPFANDAYAAVGSPNFYPASYTAVGNGNSYTFFHSNEGYPSTTTFKRVTQGIVIRGANKAGSIGYGEFYDRIFHIEIFKE